MEALEVRVMQLPTLKKEAISQGLQVTLQTRKDKKPYSPLKSPEGAQPYSYLDLRAVRCISDF